MRFRGLLSFFLLCACSAGSSKDPPPGNLGGETGVDASFDVSGLEDAPPNDGSTIIPDPTTCSQAAASRTYVGCDFWPTVTDNIVRPDFDFAAVVANTGESEATVTVTRGSTTIATVKVPGNSLEKIYLPWIPELKGVDSIALGCPTNIKTATVRAANGGYHLTSTVPVAVYQFNAIEYAGKGGPADKDWTKACANTCFGQVQCFSYTNDASLLLPSTAWTSAYRIAGPRAWKDPASTSDFTYPPYFAVTAKEAGKVTVKLSSSGAIAGGAGVAGTAAGGTATFDIAAGEVVEVVGTATSDFSGTLVTSTAPIQIIAGIACTYVPGDKPACDHVEESVLPVETLGKHYFVTRPTGPTATPNTHVVRIVGNVDGTKLTYPGTTPPGAPATINAGQVVDMGLVTMDFEVSADHELTVMTFQVGAGPVSSAGKGDPALSFATTVEQFRLKYVFLAPDDYDVNFVDVVQPMDATLTLDGKAVTAKPTAMSSGFGVTRIQLGVGNKGAHVLTGSAPVGIQVLGYGTYTSYQYPGGLNLGKIAPTPIK